MPTVIVSSITPQFGASIWFGQGIRSDRPAHVWFAGDWRLMQTIAQALSNPGPVVADVPEWAILREYRIPVGMAAA